MAAPFQDCVVLFGDSLTQQQDYVGGMQDRFSNVYRRSLDVLNRGYSGYNTRWARVIWDKLFATKDTPNVPVVRLVTIWFGANDSVMESLNPRQHVPVDEYADNIRFFLEALTSPESPYAVAYEPGLNIVLIAPPPISVAMLAGAPFPVDRSLSNTKLYVDAVLDLGKEFKAKETENGHWRIGTINMWDAILNACEGQPGVDVDESLSKYLTDGLHLTTDGYGILWDEYTKLVKNEFKNRGLDWEDANDLPRRIQNWNDVNLEDPSAILDNMRLPPIRTQK